MLGRKNSTPQELDQAKKALAQQLAAYKKLVPEHTVVKLEAGDRIRLGAAQFERLSKGFFAEIESRFL
jgi:hypothetical protein